jgi:hypothetical protein
MMEAQLLLELLLLELLSLKQNEPQCTVVNKHIIKINRAVALVYLLDVALLLLLLSELQLVCSL